MERPKATDKLFLVDSMLGRMAKWLRILGYDASIEHLTTLSRIVEHQKKGRIVVTRNTRWRRTPGVILITANETPEQIRQIIHKAGLKAGETRPFSRCIRCNEVLESVPKIQAAGKVPDYVFETVESFSRCPACGRIYWSGSHLERMTDHVRRMTGWQLETLMQRRT